MKKYLIIVVVFLSIACTTLKKETAKSKSENNLLIAQREEKLFNLNMVKVFSDSIDADEEVLFWPKGIVKYSSANGFEGEVDKMSLRKKKSTKDFAYRK